jgi:hypothetical protein
MKQSASLTSVKKDPAPSIGKNKPSGSADGKDALIKKEVTSLTPSENTQKDAKPPKPKAAENQVQSQKPATLDLKQVEKPPASKADILKNSPTSAHSDSEREEEQKIKKKFEMEKQKLMVQMAELEKKEQEAITKSRENKKKKKVTRTVTSMPARKTERPPLKKSETSTDIYNMKKKASMRKVHTANPMTQTKKASTVQSPSTSSDLTMLGYQFLEDFVTTSQKPEQPNLLVGPAESSSSSGKETPSRLSKESSQNSILSNNGHGAQAITTPQQNPITSNAPITSAENPFHTLPESVTPPTSTKMPNLIDASVRPYFTVFVNFFCSQFCVD